MTAALDGLDKTIFTLEDRLIFGKYKGYLVREIIRTHPDYIQWCLNNVKWFALDRQSHKFHALSWVKLQKREQE